MTNGSLMEVESIAERSPWSILQYFWPASSDNKSWKPIFGLFESGRFTQVLLYFLATRSIHYRNTGAKNEFTTMRKLSSCIIVEPDTTSGFLLQKDMALRYL